ncbi:MAG: AAA family ATPase [Anaerolineales bacterium]
MPLVKSKTENEIFISKRFQQIVSLHVLKNLLKRVEAQVPLLLGIHGPSGEGKTFQCENILKSMGVKRFLISGGQLDNPVPGQPSSFIRTSYIRASESINSGEASLAVVLVNDVDTGLGTWGKSEKHTINQINVFGELMHLVDYPSLVDGKETTRIPIIVTGNDFTKLYNPLVRAGRMSAFEWIPTNEEKSQIISSIFPELTDHECYKLIVELNEKLIGELPDQIKFLPVAFFSHLRANLLDEDLWEEVELAGLDKTIDSVLRGYEPDLSSKIYYERVLDKGVELARSGKLINHLQASTVENWRA